MSSTFCAIYFLCRNYTVLVILIFIMASLFVLFCFAVYESTTNCLNMDKVYYCIFLSFLSNILGLILNYMLVWNQRIQAKGPRRTGEGMELVLYFQENRFFFGKSFFFYKQLILNKLIFIKINLEVLLNLPSFLQLHAFIYYFRFLLPFDLNLHVLLKPLIEVLSSYSYFLRILVFLFQFSSQIPNSKHNSST